MRSSTQISTRTFTREAAGAIREVVGARRRMGAKSDDAIKDAAPLLGLAPRRVRDLFYGAEFARHVLLREWNGLRVRAARVLRREAERLRQLADRYDAEADALDRADGRQPELWERACDGNAGVRTRAA